MACPAGQNAHSDYPEPDAFAYAHGFAAALGLPLIERHDYERAAAQHKELLALVAPVLQNLAHSPQLSIASITSRIKTFQSCNAKIYRSRYTSFDQVDDIAGIRVVCYFRDRMRAIYDVLRGHFECADFQDRTENVAEHDFGYQAMHFSLRLPLTHARRHELGTACCEVQVRTPAMDAWALLSHLIGYKRELDIPKPLRRRLNSLSALFFVADSEFMRVRDDLEGFTRTIAARLSHGERLPLTAEVLREAVRLIFPDREVEDREQFVDLMREISQTNLTESDEVLTILKAAHKAFELYEEAFPPSFGDSYAGQGVLRYVLWMSGHLRPDDWARDYNLVPMRDAYDGPQGPHWPA